MTSVRASWYRGPRLARPAHILSVFAALTVLSAGPAAAHAEDRGAGRLDGPNLAAPPALTLADDQLHVGTADLVITGLAASVALGMAIAPPVTKRPTGGILFDEGVRDALRLGALSDRYLARDTSDVLISLLVTYPFFVDALITATWYRRSPEVGYRMMVIDAEALAITAALQGITNGLAGRERPYGRTCDASLPGDAVDCDHPVRYRSFFSGHSSLSFTAAGLLCSHHLRLDLLGGGAPDVATCGVAIAAAATTATLRIAGDMHYATDVLTGVLVGSAVGILVPLLHAGPGTRDDRTFGGVELHLVPTGNGVGVAGTF